MEIAILLAKIARVENILRALKAEGDDDKSFWHYNQGKLDGLVLALEQAKGA